MDKGSEIVLSVLVISHNQRDLLPRCLDSILGQKISVPFEIIVSDDRSSDGTWELIEEYAHKYPEIVKGVKCNSDECSPVNRSERCGWNKATVYKHARGEFFVNIDADDYLKSDEIYQKQLDLLIANPDCALCQQRVWQVNDGQPLESGYAWPKHPILKDGVKLDAATVIQNDLQGLNPTYMIRRDKGNNPAEKLGKWFNDTNITLYYLQLGKVIFLDREDYVWVQYRSSISNSVINWDRQVLYALLPLQQTLLFPQFSNYFPIQRNLTLGKLLKNSIYKRLELSDGMRNYCSEFDGFIFQYFGRGQKGIKAKIRIVKAYLKFRRIRKTNVLTQVQRDELNTLLLG